MPALIAAPLALFSTASVLLDAWRNPIVQSILITLVGLFLARTASRVIGRLFERKLHAQVAMLIRRGIFYTLATITIISALERLGLDLGVLVGAAGILTVAIGFASQTSASNLISGLFLIGERPFVIGDTIRIADITGEVLSIDLLSAKLRTFDNLYVRVPNELLIKSSITNLTHFPIRRFDFVFGVGYDEDVSRVKALLFELASINPLCLEEPAPQLIYLGFAESSQQLQFSVWSARSNFLPMRNSIQPEIKKAFDQHNIEIPYPHRALHASTGSAPLQIQLIPAPLATPPLADEGISPESDGDPLSGDGSASKNDETLEVIDTPNSKSEK